MSLNKVNNQIKEITCLDTCKSSVLSIVSISINEVPLYNSLELLPVILQKHDRSVFSF